MPIFQRRVKKARAVKISGAKMGSHWVKMSRAVGAWIGVIRHGNQWLSFEITNLLDQLLVVDGLGHDRGVERRAGSALAKALSSINARGGGAIGSHYVRYRGADQVCIKKIDSYRRKQRTATRRGVGSGGRIGGKVRLDRAEDLAMGCNEGTSYQDSKELQEKKEEKKKEELNPQRQTATIAVAVEGDDEEEFEGRRRATRSRLGDGSKGDVECSMDTNHW